MVRSPGFLIAIWNGLFVIVFQWVVLKVYVSLRILACVSLEVAGLFRAHIAANDPNVSE